MLSALRYIGIMAESPKESFNTSARRNLMAAAAVALGIAGVQQDELHTQFEASLFMPKSGEPLVKNTPEAQKNSAPLEPAPRPRALQEIWSDQGLSGEKFDAAFAALSAEQKDRLALRSQAFFAQAGFTDVMQRMAEGKQKKLNDLLAKIADIPPGMRLITTDYNSIESEQNKIVWQEFQERAEPAFYRHIAATQETALREAGFCDYAIDCTRRGHGPTNKDGIHYNVDIDHLTERKGGGAMCMEKSVDPVLGGAPMYPINHVSNLCLIMRDVHTQTKNTINGLQDIGAIPAGETRRIVMAVPEEGKELLMLHPQDIRAGMQPPTETSYFALGPSLLIMRDLERYKKNIVSQNAAATREFFDDVIRDDFSHTLKLWTALALTLEHADAEGTLKTPSIKSTIKNCNDYLKPLENLMAEIQAPQDALENLVHISHRIYGILSPSADGERAPSATGKQTHGHA